MCRYIQVIILLLVCCLKAWADESSYNIKDLFTISISNDMEIRKAEDSYTHFLYDTLCCYSNTEIVFQQKDLSALDGSAMEKYCRVMIITDEGSGDYPCCNEENFANEDIEELKSYAIQELAPGKVFPVYPRTSVESTIDGYKFYKGVLRTNWIQRHGLR